MTKYHHYTGHTTQTYRKLYGYKNLLAWQAADELAASVHRLVVRFPQRYYKLANQMLGSASSAKANIAERYCRNAIGDYIRFCEIARGSLGTSQESSCFLDKKMFNHEGHEDHEGKIIEKTSCPSCPSWLISSGSGSARLGELGSQIQDCERWELIKAGDLQPLLKHFSDATYFLEGLIKGLRAKRKEGTWDRSLGVKEETGEYPLPDAEIPLTLPDEFPDRNAEDQDETQENQTNPNALLTPPKSP